MADVVQTIPNEPNAPTLDGRHLVGIKHIVGKGKGIVAVQDIPRGTLILIESPLLYVHGQIMFPGIVSVGPLDVAASVKNLTPQKQAAFFDLHGHVSETLEQSIKWKNYPPLLLLILGIWEANNFATGVFEIASRFNHSCTPNVDKNWNEDLKKTQFMVIRDVKQGEELSVSYLPDDWEFDRVERLAKLKLGWGFDCDCLLCDGSSASDVLEKKRKEAAVIWRQLPFRDLPKPGNVKSALMECQKAAYLLNSVGIVGVHLESL